MSAARVTVTPSSTSTTAPRAFAVVGDASRKRRAATAVISGTRVPAACALTTERNATPRSFRERYRSARSPQSALLATSGPAALLATSGPAALLATSGPAALLATSGPAALLATSGPGGRTAGTRV